MFEDDDIAEAMLTSVMNFCKRRKINEAEYDFEEERKEKERYLSYEGSIYLWGRFFLNPRMKDPVDRKGGKKWSKIVKLQPFQKHGSFIFSFFHLFRFFQCEHDNMTTNSNFKFSRTFQLLMMNF